MYLSFSDVVLTYLIPAAGGGLVVGALLLGIYRVLMRNVPFGGGYYHHPMAPAAPPPRPYVSGKPPGNGSSLGPTVVFLFLLTVAGFGVIHYGQAKPAPQPGSEGQTKVVDGVEYRIEGQYLVPIQPVPRPEAPPQPEAKSRSERSGVTVNTPRRAAASRPERPEALPVRDFGAYAVQVYVFGDRDRSLRRAAELVARGHDAHSVRYGNRHCVVIVGFPSHAAADAYRRQHRRDLPASSYPVRSSKFR